MADANNIDIEELNKQDFKEIDPGVWKPEKEGDSIEGILVQKRENVGKNHSNAYYLEKDGKQIMVWGSTIIDDRMEFVNIGDMVRITFKETTTNKAGQPLKIYKVAKAII